MTATLRVERNAGRLGLCSIQTRLDVKQAWRETFRVVDRAFEITGSSVLGRPRGRDADLLLGIEREFIAQGLPADNWLHTTSNSLLSSSLLAKNGDGFHRLHEGLNRLWSVGYVIREGWTLPSGQRVAIADSFRLLDRVIVMEQEDGASNVSLMPRSSLRIQLGTPFAESIRHGCTQALDLTLMRSLRQPPARTLYRALESHRRQDDGTVLNELAVSLPDWRAACGISSDLPDKIRRTLEPAHAELQSAGYLSDISYTGRGMQAHLTYVFTQQQDHDPALVILLTQQGMGRKQAIIHARERAAQIPEALEFLKHRLVQGGVRNPGALLHSFLTRRSDFVFPPPSSASSHKVVSSTVDEKFESHKEQANREAEEEMAQRRSHINNLPPDQQYEQLKSSLNLMLRSLGTDLLSRLEQKCRRGELSAGLVHDKCVSATAANDQLSFLDNLRADLTIS